MAATSVTMRTAGWPLVALPALVVAVLLAGLLAVPAEVQRIDTLHYVIFIAGLTAVLAALSIRGWRQFGAEGLQADSTGVSIASRRHGSRYLRWADVDELGWVPTYGWRQGGLAGRAHDPALRPSGTQAVHWLCQPSGWINPSKVKRLQLLAQQAGVPWRTYRQAEVS